jgi:hypothetical protein
VGVPDRTDGVRAGVRGPGQHLDQALAGGHGGAGDVVQAQRVERAFQGAQDLVPARVGLGQLQHQLAQHLQVVVQVPDVLVQHREVGPGQPVEGCVAGGRQVAERGGHEPVVQDVRVGGRLDEQLDRPGPGDRDVLVARCDALDRVPVRVVDQPFRLPARPVADPAEVEHGLHPAPGPVRRHDAGGPEPASAPGPAPLLPDAERFVAGGQRLRHRHRLARHLPHGQVERDPFGVDGRQHALLEHPVQAPLDQLSVIMHVRPLQARR